MMGDFWQDVMNTAKDVAGVIAPFAGGGLSFLGGLLTNSANEDIARANRHFVRNMYKKRYQFTVEDMRKAGLNPILAANGGSVGSVPSVSTPTMTNALEAGVSGALSTARAVSDIRAQSVSNAKVEADQKLAEANTHLAQGKKIEQDIRNAELPKTVRAQAFKAEAEASLANSASVIQRARTEFADQLARNEEVKSYNDAVGSKYRNLSDFWNYHHKKKDFYARPSVSEERNWWRAKKILDSVGSGVNSAVGAGKFMRYMRYFR